MCAGREKERGKNRRKDMDTKAGEGLDEAERRRNMTGIDLENWKCNVRRVWMKRKGMIYQINLIQKLGGEGGGDYFKRNSKTGFAAPISMLPVEQRATTGGTGIGLR